MDIGERLDSFGSARALGEELHRRVGAPEAPTSGSCGTYVSKLRRGDRRWWLRPEAAPFRTALADVLEVDEAELFPELARTAAEDLFAVRSFPALHCFSPGEPAVDIGVVVETSGSFRFPFQAMSARGFVAYVLDRRDRPTWVRVPPGAGKTFAVAYARTQGRRAGQAEYLADIVTANGAAEGAIIEVLSLDPARDHQAVERLSEVRATVLARFSRPTTSTLSPTADGPTKPSTEQPGWIEATWRPSIDGRRQLVSWAAGRVPDDSLLWGQAEETVTWIEKLDPSAHLLGDPATVLWLLGRVHELGLRKCRGSGLIKLHEEYLAIVADQIRNDFPDAALFVRERGSEILQHLANARLWRLELSINGAAPRSSWAELLPPSLVQLTGLMEKLMEMPSGSRRVREKAAARLASDIETAKPVAVLTHLSRAGLFVGETNDRLALHPPWIVEEWVSQALDQAVRSGSLEWGRLCFDPDRRSRVDRALDTAMAEPTFIKQLLQAIPTEARTCEEIGVVEATFAAVGRALLQDAEPLRGIPGIHRLWGAQMNTCIRRYPPPDLPRPASRRGEWSQSVSWFESCWAWSFELPPPSSTIPAEFLWLFPGWTKPRLEDQPAPWMGDSPTLFKYLVRLWSERPSARPGQQAGQAERTAWVWSRLLLELPIDRLGKDHHTEWNDLARMIDDQRDWDSTRTRSAALSLIRAFSRTVGNPIWVTGPTDKPDLHRLLMATLDGKLAVELASAEPHPSVREYIRRTPEACHLEIVKWWLAQRTTTEPPEQQQGMEETLSLDALRWLAQQRTDLWWVLRAWAARDPESAYEWLASHPWTNIGPIEMVSQLPRELQDRTIDWITAKPREARPEQVPLLAASLLERRPDLAPRLVPLLLFIEPDRG